MIFYDILELQEECTTKAKKIIFFFIYLRSKNLYYNKKKII